MAALIDSVMQTALITNAATSSTAGSYTVPDMGASFTLVEIAVTQAVYINYTATATTTNGEYWPAGMVKVKKCNPGQTISYIRDTTDGRITLGAQV